MAWGRIKLVTEAHRIIRPVCLSIVAIAVLACAMAIVGWNVTSLILGAIFLLIACVLIYQVHHSVRHLHCRSSDLEMAAAQAEQHYVGVLRKIVRFVEARDEYLRDHSERVGQLSEKIAGQLNLPVETCEAMMLAGQLHDIGMMAIPEKILSQRSRLGAADFRCVMEHPDIAFEVLEPLKSLEGILPAIRYHHERMNGTGYPHGLSGQSIPIEAQILAVADAYDAMTHD
ncbi:MAG: HD domain-containing protein, partial [Phycisphaerae bacterium]|nr:HD domain-containing protein [Phycisphaerae bacterium]